MKVKLFLFLEAFYAFIECIIGTFVHIVDVGEMLLFVGMSLFYT
jgi:hypothetical protein